MKIAFTNSEHPKIIRTFFYLRAPIKKTTQKDRWAVREKSYLWPHLGNYPHYFEIAFTNSESDPDSAIMRIIAAPQKCG